MLDALRTFYARLPIIRELRRTAASVEGLSWGQWHLLREALCDYEERLLSTPRYSDPRNLNRHEFQVFSQFGEDGMIAEVFRRIGTASKTFLEIGIGDGPQNNTAFLFLQGWSGWWIDANGDAIRRCRDRFRGPITQKRLVIGEEFVKAESIRSVVDKLGVPAELDLFSLDIDRNTYYVWEALAHLRPRLAVIEYNAAFPPELDWKVDYDPDLVWNHTMYFGASLKAYELLGKRIGYSLVGCNLGGANAFFVRDDLCGDLFEGPFTSEKHYQPFRPFLERRKGHPLSFGDKPL
jgi:hypothetical protein